MYKKSVKVYYNKFLFLIVLCCLLISNCVVAISVCSWNIKDIGNSKNEFELEFIAKTIKNYDNILSFLYKEGFIQYFFLRNNKLVVGLRYFLGENNLKGVIIISRPSFYKNIRYKDITKIKQTNNVVAVSTDAGILNLYDCKKQKIGGKILFVC
jgi:ribosomal protein S8